MADSAAPRINWRTLPLDRFISPSWRLDRSLPCVASLATYVVAKSVATTGDEDTSAKLADASPGFAKLAKAPTVSNIRPSVESGQMERSPGRAVSVGNMSVVSARKYLVIDHKMALGRSPATARPTSRTPPTSAHRQKPTPSSSEATSIMEEPFVGI